METTKTGQKLIQCNGQSWLLVEVPEDAKDFQLLTMPGDVDFWKLPPKDHVDLYANGILNTPLVSLPPGSYTLYGKGSDLTEDKWREIVADISFCRPNPYNVEQDEVVNCWQDYMDETEQLVCYTATESGKSWLTHHQFKPNGCVILKLVK